MGNEPFLIIAYFSVGALCLSFGAWTFLWLRRPADYLFGLLRHAVVTRILARAFRLSYGLVPFAAFLSVDYIVACTPHDTYEKVVSDRPYLIDVNLNQIHTTAHWLIAAIFIWLLIVLLVLRAVRYEGETTPKR